MTRHTLLITVVVVIGTVASGGFATASEPQPVDASTAGEPLGMTHQSVSFTTGQFTEQRGDVIELALELSHGDTASFTLGSETDALNVSGTVEDVDGDGRVTVAVNTVTYSVRATGADTVRQTAATTPDEPLPVGEYRVRAVEGDRPPAASDGGATARVRLTDPEPTALRTFTAPAAFDPANVTRLQQARRAGTIASAETVAAGDLVVYELAASGLEGTVAAADGDTLTERFFDAVNVSLDRVSTANDPKQVVLGPASTTVFAAEDRYYLVVDSAEVPVDTFTTRVAVESTPAPELFDGPQTADLTVAAPSVTFTETDTTPAAGRIGGETNLAPGSELRVTIRADEFDRATTAVVQPDGTFQATFQLPAAAAGDGYTLRAFPTSQGPSAASGEPIGTANGTLVGTASPTPTATDTPPVTTTDTPQTTDPSDATEAATPGFTALLGLVAVVLTLGLLARRR